MTTAECPICINTYTTLVRKPICCPKCNYSCCIQCVKQYLLGLVDDPHCMNCNFRWTPSFLRQNLTLSFMNNDWSNHRRQILWRREEAYLPESQIVAERIVRGRRMEKELDPLKERYKEMQEALEDLENDLKARLRMVTRLKQGLDDSSGGSAKKSEDRKTFVRRCTFTGCNGFLSTAWKCGICENFSCPECLAVKGPDRDAPHTCDANDLATAKLLAKDTKPCPKCGEGIFRTEGCSQMFCTACKTPFDWNTGKIISGGNIHNPHYFAYMRENDGVGPARAVGDILCGGLPGLRSLRNLNKTHTQQMEKIYRAINHTIDIEAPRFNAHITEVHNQEYRVKFLLNDMEKDEIERILINQEKRRERHRVIREVLDTFGNIGAEIFRRFCAECEPKHATDSEIYNKLWTQYANELDALREYCNKELIEISYYYKCSVPQWNSEWAFSTTSEADIRRFERDRVEEAIAYHKTVAALAKATAAEATAAEAAAAEATATEAAATATVSTKKKEVKNDTIILPGIPGIAPIEIKVPSLPELT